MWRCVVMLVAGCGRFGFDDVAVDADTQIDAQPDAAPLGMFGTPMLISELNTVGVNDDPALTPDELEIFFSTGRAGDCTVWTATRMTVGAMWTAPTQAIAVAGRCVATAFISRDGLTAWLAIRNVDFDLYETRRADRTSAWQTPTLITELSSAADDFDPSVTADGLAIYFNSNRGGNHDVYVATRALDTDPWSVPTRIDELSTTFGDGSPYISPTGTEVWFGSDRPGSALGDLWVATRATTTEPFGTAQPVIEVNSATNEGDPWVSDDRRRIYFSRFTSTTAAIFMAIR